MMKAIRSWLVLGLLAGGFTLAVTTGASCGSDDKKPSDPGTGGNNDPGTAGTSGGAGAGGGTTGTAGTTPN